MCLAGSDKYLSVLEGECVYLPLPYKEDQALVTCFYWIQIRSELPERKTCRFSLSYSDAKYSAFQPGTSCDFRVACNPPGV